jgi:CRP-like cAMP-binding protein
MFQLLINHIEKHISLTEYEKTVLTSYLISKQINKREFLLQESEISTYSAFVLSGCLRAYTIDENGHEHILQFAIEDWWISDMMSFTTQKKGNLTIDAIENSHVALISRKDQLELFDKCPKLERYFRIITENGMVSFQHRILEYISLPASERYANFAKRYPLFIKRLPQNQIAAYLGITPEFLSKIRHQSVLKKQ